MNIEYIEKINISNSEEFSKKSLMLFIVETHVMF